MKEKRPEIPGFELIERCGKGATAEVWWAIDDDGFRRAIRIIKTSQTPPELLEKEKNSIAAYRSAAGNDPHLIEILYIGETQEYLYYVMPLADSAFPAQCRYTPMTLAVKLQRAKLTTDEIFDIFGTLLEAVGSLHRNGLAHHDLKPENIIFVDGVLKIADPGLVTDANAISRAGSPSYKSDFLITGIKSDIFALGKILYCMYTNFSADRFPELPANFDLDDPYFEFNAIALKCCERRRSYEHIEDIQRDFAASRKIPFSTAFKKKAKRALPYILAAGLLIGAITYLVTIKIPALRSISIQVYVTGN